MTAVVGRWVNFCRERVDLDKGSVDGAANVGEGGEFLEGLNQGQSQELDVGAAKLFLKNYISYGSITKIIELLELKVVTWNINISVVMPYFSKGILTKERSNKKNSRKCKEPFYEHLPSKLKILLNFQ